MAHMNKLLQFPSQFLKSPLISFPKIPIQLSYLHRPSLTLSSLIPHHSSPSNSPNFLLISTSLESDGSLVFKFGDATELPAVDIEVELETLTDDSLAINHQPEFKQDLEVKGSYEVEEIAEKTVVNDVVEDKTGEYNDNVAISNQDSIHTLSHVPSFDTQAALEYEDIELEAEPILDHKVNYDGIPSIAAQDDSPGGDITDAAFPNLEESVVISEPNVNREEISLHSEDISALSLPMSSTSYPLKLNDASPSAVLQSDDNPGSINISEPAGPVPELSATASEEAHLNGVQTSSITLLPSAMASLPQAPKVNDAITPSVQLLDADLHSEIFVAADPESGISAEAETNLRVGNSELSLCVVSAAASVAHPSEALAGGVDAYFICDNWFGVADGVGQWSFGGIDKGLYAQELIQNCERLARKNLNTGLNSLKDLLQESAARTESSGAARVLVAHIVDQVLHVANIGDSGFIVVRKGTVFKKSSPMFHEFNFPYAVSFGENPVEAVEEYHVELEDGDIIVTATDGLFDNLYEREIASLVFKAMEDGKNMKEIAQLLASRSQEVGRSAHAITPFADAAQAAGHTEFSGGKFDHVTVIVSILQKE